MGSVSLTDHQWEAVKKAADWYKTASNDFEPDWDRFHAGHDYDEGQQSFVFAGYAGSGKSTCVGTMIEHLGLTEEQVMYMAPTGKAAKVLTKKLRNDGWNTPATTIHKAIYMPRTMKADYIEREMTRFETALSIKGDPLSRFPDPMPGMSERDIRVRLAELENALREAMDGEGPSFSLKPPQDLPPGVKLFVVDEASMVGTTVAQDLARFGIPILAIGDPGQLPPVGSDWGFDMDDPNVFLTEIHRQAAENPIIRLATLARQGEMLKVGNYGDDVKVVNRRDDDVTLNMDRDAMVLVGTHRKRWQLTDKIRKNLGYTENGPMAGEPLLVVKNSRQHAPLVNGTILNNMTDHGDLQNGNVVLRLRASDPEADNLEYDLNCVQAVFEEHALRKQNSYTGDPRSVFAAKVKYEQVDWGHVLTVHKSQGSEWDDVVVHDESGVFRDQGPRWLYTGITRAANKLTVVV